MNGRITLSVVGAVLTSLPWIGHMHSASMVRHADRAFALSIGVHAVALLVLLTALQSLGRVFEGVVVLIWMFGFWLTFPNF